MRVSECANNRDYKNEINQLLLTGGDDERRPVWSIHFLDEQLFRSVPTNDITKAFGSINLPDNKTALPAEFWDLQNPFCATDGLYNYAVDDEDGDRLAYPQGRYRPAESSTYVGGEYVIRSNVGSLSPLLRRNRDPQPSLDMWRTAIVQLLVQYERDYLQTTVSDNGERVGIPMAIRTIDRPVGSFEGIPTGSIDELKVISGVRNSIGHRTERGYIPVARSWVDLFCLELVGVVLACSN